MGKVPNWERLFVHRKQGLFSSVHVGGCKMAGRKQNTGLMWKKFMKLVDLGEPTSFLDHVNVTGNSWAPEISTSPFFPCFRGIRTSFVPTNCRIKWGGSNVGRKTTNFEPVLIKKALRVNFITR